MPNDANTDHAHRRARIWEQVKRLLLERARKRASPETKGDLWARCLRRQVDIIRRRYQASPHYADEKFQEGYARRYGSQLLERREEITQAYLRFMRRRSLVTHLEQHAPKLLTWVTWQVRVLELADRHDVEETLSPPPKEKETPQQFFERKLKQLTESLERTATIQQTTTDWVESQLEGIEDEDEREQARQRLLGIVNRTITALNKPKDATTTTLLGRKDSV